MPLFRPRIRPLSGKIEPCLSQPAKEPPAGPDWIHEIKHDGFRITGAVTARVRLISRNGHDLTFRFPLITTAIAQLAMHSCLIDSEAIVSDDNGLAVYQLLRNYRRGNAATFYAFDLIELNGKDLRLERLKTVSRR
jgi:bifunctional non-homologous end joining protein LigD